MKRCVNRRQDFAHLAIACIRSLGLPARYVCGYPETMFTHEAKLVGVDASHTWFAVDIPGVGWLDFDPTNNHMPAEQHITIGWGRDYSDIAPLKGVLFSRGQHQLSVLVDVKEGRSGKRLSAVSYSANSFFANN